MIIRSSRLTEGQTLEEKDGKLILTNSINIDPVLKANYEARKDSKDGYTDGHTMRRVASVPFPTWLVWTRDHPELLIGDKELKEKTLKKLLYQEESRPYWTVGKGI